MRNSYTSFFVFVVGIMFAFNSFSQVQQTWVQRYSTFTNEAPVAIKTNGSSVYVLGVLNQFQTTSDVVLIKYNSAGTFQWAQVYNGPGNNQDSPTAMTLDGAGNIYVVGRSTVAINNGTSSETFTLKYDAAGALLWVARYFRPDTFPSELNSVAVDASGNVYSSGSTIAGAPFAYDFMTIKYNSAGVEQWIRTYNGTANSVDMDTRVAVDFSGNIIVTGESQGLRKKGRFTFQTFADVFTIKYDPNGNTIWTQRYNNTSYNKGERPKGLALDFAGNVYITGEGANASNNDILTLKYNSNGKLVYAAQYNGAGHDGGKGIVANALGEAYITGFSDPSGGSDYNYKTIKYSPDGTQVWEQTHNGAANGTDIANAIAMDGFGNVYVTGESQSTYGYDFVTIRYSSTGVRAWTASYNGPAFNSDKAVALAVYTPFGPAFQNASVYVTGGSDGLETGLDIATVKYTQPLVIGNFATVAVTSLSNYPNPFSQSTTIQYNLAYDSQVAIKIVDVITGREVETMELGEQKAGEHEQLFSPRVVKKGNYLYKIVAESSAGQFTESKLMRIEN